MHLEIRPVTEQNLDEILALRVKREQLGYIESVEECLRDAGECEYYEPAALYLDKTPVGFAMYGLFPNEGEKGRVWLDRLLIDQAFQGKGIGKAALRALLSHLKKIYGCDRIYLSLYENNRAALDLYRKFGFSFIDERDVNGEAVMVKRLSTQDD